MSENSKCKSETTCIFILLFYYPTSILSTISAYDFVGKEPKFYSDFYRKIKPKVKYSHFISFGMTSAGFQLYSSNLLS